MTIYSIYVINKAGGLIYQYDHTSPRLEAEKTFGYPLELTLKIHDEKVMVAFGQRDGIKVGHVILGVNGVAAAGRSLEDGRDILEVLATEANYPINIKFGRPKLSTNERIMLAGIKFVVITDPRQSGQDLLLKKLYEIYADYALKNPFYSMDMPIRCELFDVNLQQALEQAEKFATT